MNERQYVTDRLALAIIEHGPASASQLATRLAVRKADVLHELNARPLFENLGNGRGSSWRIAAHGVSRGLWEPKGTD